MNKKGFTLVEIIAVIALIAVVMIIIAPNLIKTLGDSTTKAMKIQEKEVAEAGLLYLEDHCKNPIDGKKCIGAYNNPFHLNSDYTYTGQVTLEMLINEKYIEPVELSGETCKGCIYIEHNDPNVYVKCGEKYETEGYNSIIDQCIIVG